MKVFIVLEEFYCGRESEVSTLATFFSYEKAVEFRNKKCENFKEKWDFENGGWEMIIFKDNDYDIIQFTDGERYFSFGITQNVIKDETEENKLINNIKNIKSKIVLDALEIITSNEKNINLFKDLIESSLFFTTNHDCHDCKKCEEIGGCDDCYSGDTEFEYTEKIKNKAKELFKNMFFDEDDEAEDSYDEDDPDYIHPDDLEEIKSNYISQGIELPTLSTFK